MTKFGIKKQQLIEEFETADISNQMQVLSIDDGHWVVKHQDKIIKAIIHDFDPATKSYKIELDGIIHELTLLDQVDLIMEQMGMNVKKKTIQNNYSAPMPGLIIDVLVSEGQEVKEGDSLVIVEAMKMENIIKSTHDAVIKEIKVAKGDKVEKGEVLIEL